MRVSLEESLLQHVFRIVIVFGDLLSHPEDAAIIMLDEFVKGGLITGFGTHYERGFVEGWRYGGGTHAGGTCSLAGWS